MEEYVVAALVDARERNYREIIRLETIRDVSNPFEMAEEKFKKMFRLPRSGASYLINVLDDPRLHMGHIPKHLKILAALHFFAQGSYQAEVAQDSFMGLSQPTVSSCLTITADVIVQQLTPQFIKFPRSEAEIESAMRRNYREIIRLETIRDVSNPFEMAEEKFKKMFRLPRSGASYLINVLDDPRLHMGHIPKHLKILAALHFFAQGSYQAEVAQDSFMGLSQPTVSSCLTITADVIVQQLTPQFIKFPRSEAEIESAMRSFQELYQMPNTLGAVDGTHFSIAKPPLSHPTAPGSIFYNRKGFYSINCQIVCSAKGKIIGMNPNFPGSTHDAAIWRSSRLYRLLRNAYIRGEQNQWLLGDKGYPLQPWLMTPLMEPSTPAEERYNKYHARARNVVEMCNGRLKNKFRCLHRHRTLHYKPTKAARIILACCTLYNIFLDALTDADEDQVIQEVIDDASPYQELDTDFLAQARIIRQGLINRYFNE